MGLFRRLIGRKKNYEQRINEILKKYEIYGIKQEEPKVRKLAGKDNVNSYDIFIPLDSDDLMQGYLEEEGLEKLLQEKIGAKFFRELYEYKMKYAVPFRENVSDWINDVLNVGGLPIFLAKYASKPFVDELGRAYILGRAYRAKGKSKWFYFDSVSDPDYQDILNKRKNYKDYRGLTTLSFKPTITTTEKIPTVAFKQDKFENVLKAYPNVEFKILNVKELKSRKYVDPNVVEDIIEKIKETVPEYRTTIFDTYEITMPDDRSGIWIVIEEKELDKEVGLFVLFQEKEEKDKYIKADIKKQEIGACFDCLVKHTLAAKKLFEEAIDRANKEGGITSGVRDKIIEAVSEIEGAQKDIDITNIKKEEHKQFLTSVSTRLRDIRKDLFNAGLFGLKGSVKDIENALVEIKSIIVELMRALEQCGECHQKI